MKQIEKPDWNGLTEGEVYVNHDTRVLLDTWFTKHVQPINEALAAGVEVVGKKEHPMEPVDFWSSGFEGNYSALLINIKPLKVESPADVLREFLDQADTNRGWEKHREYNEWKARAQAALKNETQN